MTKPNKSPAPNPKRRRAPVHPDERIAPLLPPRKRDWKPGTVQLGLFMRTERGATIQSVMDTATELQVQRARDLMHDRPGDVYAALAEALDILEEINGDESSCSYNALVGARAVELREAFKR